MTEVKPIAVIYFPDQYYEKNNRNWIYEYAAALNGEKLGRWNLSTDFSDYHWFCFYKIDIDAPALVVYHPKDFTEIQFQELRDMVIKEIDNLKQPI